MKKTTVFLTTLIMIASMRTASAKTVTIAVIDTGIDPSVSHLCKFGHKSFARRYPNPLIDENGHGTHVSGLIASNAGDGDYCLVAIKYYDETVSGQENLRNLVKAMQYAVNIDVNFINISGGGPEFSESEYGVIKEALTKHITLVVAAGNEKSDLDKECDYYPACYDTKIVSVGNLDSVSGSIELPNTDERHDKDRSPSSNYGRRVTRWEIGTNVESTLPGGRRGRMTGTSQATAVATGKLVLETLHK
jgi:subtilisin family serine protease